MRDSNSPHDWTTPDWHPDYGDAKSELHHLRELALAVLSTIPSASAELEIPEPGLMYLRIGMRDGAIAEVHSNLGQKASDARRFAIFVPLGSSEEQEAYTTTIEEAISILIAYA